MGSMEKGFVHYCCVAKGGRILQAYSSSGDHEIEKLATLCLEKVPLYHRWYSQTMNGRTFFFLVEDGFVYFVIANQGTENSALLRFLERVRNEFKKITKKSSGFGRKGVASHSNPNPNPILQDQLVPVIRQLITSLQKTGGNGNGNGKSLNASPCNANYGEATSTKAPLLGKTEKKVKDHLMIGMRGIEVEENYRAGDRGRGLRGGDLECNATNAAGDTVSPFASNKDGGIGSTSMRVRSQTVRRKWCHLVRLVLIVDGFICVALLVAWLLICKGLQCVRT